jgi:ABC-2 type transport system ATP-binding protein
MRDLPPARPAVEVRDLRVVRGGRVVLPDVSLDIPAGVVTGLLGPSGSGKSTLLRSLVGVQVVERGEVTVLGLPAGTPALRRRVAYVTQAPSVYVDLSVRENLRYFARILDVPTDRVAEVLETVGLGALEARVAGTLSGGERSRVSLAAALLGEPELLVLDEPTVGLDPVLRLELWRSFHELAREGKTILVSTHVMDEADRCNELVLQREGAVVATGSPEAIRAETGCDALEQAFIAIAEAS